MVDDGAVRDLGFAVVGYTLKHVVDDCCYRNRKLDGPFVRGNAIAAFEDLWRSHLWKFRRVRGQIAAVADYSTGSIATLSQAGTAVVGDSTVWGVEFVFRHLRPTNNSSNGDVRDYLITARASDTSITIEDPYEGSAIASNTAYTIYKRWYTLPPDFSQLEIPKESAGGIIVDHISRDDLENIETSPNSSGQPYWIVDAGNSTLPLWSTGTVTMTEGTAVVAGSGTAWVSARDKGRRYRVRGMPQYGDFTILSVDTDTQLTLNRPWRGPTKSAQAYDIDPAGEPLVELFPRPAGNTSVEMWYYKKLPPIAIDTEMPQGLPEEFHDAWLFGTFARVGLVPQSAYLDKLGPLMAKQGLVAHEVVRQAPYGSGGRPQRSLLPSNYPAHYRR